MEADELLKLIEKHIAQTGSSETRFGAKALGDPNLVRDLRKGRELRRLTRQRVMDYIATGGASASQAA